MANPNANPDYLKSLSEISAADLRNRSFGNESIENHHARVAELTLSPAVPEPIKVQFETAKNVYLYAWFVFRFYPVANQQALASLELGLRERFPEPLPRECWDRPKQKPGLNALLCAAVKAGAVKNEGFRRWHKSAEQQARQRYANERRELMIELGLSEIEIDYDLAVPNESDQEWDLVDVLLKTLPKTRNALAHGSTQIDGQVLGTLELVCEILNQVFKAESPTKS